MASTFESVKVIKSKISRIIISRVDSLIDWSNEIIVNLKKALYAVMVFIPEIDTTIDLFAHKTGLSPDFPILNRQN